ncbi:hypothetical protein SELR_13480 [Selenomonas ruminantium subsp. lactilytica TAM6421]|uniref:Uncharacterized protein n=1 Tax=Selenomonas ruminantium subsp. lactilytica (strain NBRC 103574 / TAM6421) TaxID=927704 RepID=I0GQL9_SELRL|nr:hypothetical protein [Selenomonas ruminantium]BAL83056.1 hypothetical protein SELR_13480 [Selenomonas ruminantium subsp. lactilytica TAM6421]
MDIMFQRKGGPYTIKVQEEALAVSHSVVAGDKVLETFKHEVKPGYDEEERSFSYVAALDYVAETLVKKSPEMFDLKAYQQEYYAPEKQSLSVWLKATPESLARITGQKLADRKELEEIYADRGVNVKLDSRYKDASKFHLTAALLCEKSGNEQMTSDPKKKLLKDMEIISAKGMARGE